jgi:molybdopterin converting factor small subunit
LEAIRRHNKETKAEIETLKDTAQQVENLLRKEVDELRAEVEEMVDLLKVKDRMLDDQNVAIS